MADSWVTATEKGKKQLKTTTDCLIVDSNSVNECSEEAKQECVILGLLLAMKLKKRVFIIFETN